jgi:hypothetical protein
LKTLSLILTGLIAILLLAACGTAAQPLVSTVDAVPTAATPIPTETPTLRPTQTATSTPAPTATQSDADIRAIPLDCTDGANINEGVYRAENNTWGKGNLTGWSQCIGLKTAADGTLSAHWTWDWLQPSKSGGGVKAYPEIIFGQKPGGAFTSMDLPRQIKDLKEVTITYDVASTHDGAGNLAFDIWLTDTASPATFGVPPITHEIMIWREYYGSTSPGGRWTENVVIDGVKYSVYLSEKWGSGWMYIAFNPVDPQVGEGSINLVSFLDYMQKKGYVTGDRYVADVEFGNEVTNGTGETVLRKYRVTVK